MKFSDLYEGHTIILNNQTYKVFPGGKRIPRQWNISHWFHDLKILLQFHHRLFFFTYHHQMIPIAFCLWTIIIQWLLRISVTQFLLYWKLNKMYTLNWLLYRQRLRKWKWYWNMFYVNFIYVSSVLFDKPYYSKYYLSTLWYKLLSIVCLYYTSRMIVCVIWYYFDMLMGIT